MATGGFKKREEALERKFQHDQELAFKIKSRAFRKMAYWSGKMLGFNDVDLETYAHKRLRDFVQSQDHTTVIRDILLEMGTKNQSYSYYQLLKILDNFVHEATRELHTPRE